MKPMKLIRIAVTSSLFLSAGLALNSCTGTSEPMNLRTDERQERRDDRQDNRGDRQDDRQDNRDDRQNDRQDRRS